MLIATAHVLGAIIAVIVFGFIVAALGAWEQERNRKAVIQEVSIALGIPAEELDDQKHAATLIRFSADRFSSELLRNRISDLCGLLSTVWNWLGTALQVVLLGAVIWYSFSNSSVAVNAWWILAIAIFFWLASVVFALICKLLTGRYPGQAKLVRNQLALFVASPKPTTVAPDQNAA
jgi:hypothetical protein